jgi:pimeloyl-ACP methyl ester carboxylesterase
MLLSSIGNPLDFLAEGSRLEVINDAGHFMHVEQPETVNRLVLEFLAS